MIGLLDIIRTPLPIQPDGESPHPALPESEPAGENFLSLFFTMLVAPTALQTPPQGGEAANESTVLVGTDGSASAIMPSAQPQRQSDPVLALMRPVAPEEFHVFPEHLLPRANRDAKEQERVPSNASTDPVADTDIQELSGPVHDPPAIGSDTGLQVTNRPAGKPQRQLPLSDSHQMPEMSITGSRVMHSANEGISTRKPQGMIPLSAPASVNSVGHADGFVPAPGVSPTELKAIAEKFTAVQMKDSVSIQLQKPDEASVPPPQAPPPVVDEPTHRVRVVQNAGESVGADARGSREHHPPLQYSSASQLVEDSSQVSPENPRTDGEELSQPMKGQPVVTPEGKGENNRSEQFGVEGRPVVTSEGPKGHSMQGVSSPLPSPDLRSVVAGKAPAEPVPPRFPNEFGRDLMLKISDEVRLHLDGKTSEIRVRLKPEVLGELSLRMALVEGTVTAVIEASQQNVRAVLEAQVPQMREALASQGIDVRRFEILSGGEMQSRHSGEEHSSKRHRRVRGKEDVDVAERFQGMKQLGYNTVEYII